MKKIDAHAHIGNFGNWAGVESNIDSLLSMMDEYEIEKTILCSKDHLGNEEILQIYREYPERFFPLVYLNPLEEKEITLQKIERYVDEGGFYGIKLNPLRHAYVADDLILDPIMIEAEKREIPVFIHSGHPPYSLPFSIGLLAERFPNVKIVMIHMGHGHGVYIDAALKMAKKYDNLYLEMSGMPMGSKIKQAYEEIGTDRIMFGTDFPFHHPLVEIQKVLTCGVEEEGLEQIFYENALKLISK